MNKRTVLAFPADTHSGSTVGLMSPDAWNLDEGGTYHPSPLQRLIWQQWEECWERVRQLRKRSRLIVSMMGDAVDGTHHQTTELITHRKEEQERIHIDCMDWALKRTKFRNDDVLQYITGTPSHVGNSSEERIARDLEARPASESKFVHKRFQFSVNGVVFDLAHKCFSVGRRAWTDNNVLNAMLKSFYFRTLDTKQSLPRYKIGAHWHTFLKGIYDGRQGTIEGFVCPGFQWLTTFSSMVTNNEPMIPSVGMLIVVVEEDGRSWWECPQFEMPERKIEEL